MLCAAQQKCSAVLRRMAGKQGRLSNHFWLLLKDVDNNSIAKYLKSEPVLNTVKAARNGLGPLQIPLSGYFQ